MYLDGNVFLNGAKPSKFEKNPEAKADFNPGLKLAGQPDGLHLEADLDKISVTDGTRKIVTSKVLGKASVPNLPFEQPDGSPLRLNTDYFGHKRNKNNPAPGPFDLASGQPEFKVW